MLRFLARKPKPAIPPGERIYAIGDIHGRLDLFETLLEDIRRDNAAREPARTQILLLGDLIDRGPDSAGVVALAMRPPDVAPIRALLGNHEAAMLAALDGDRDMLRIWLRNGGREALVSWGLSVSELDTMSDLALIKRAQTLIPREQRAWIARCALSIQVGDYYFVHAGVRPGTPLARQKDEDRLWIRDAFLDSEADHGAIVVHGHSASPDVEELPNRIGIDTGAYATDRLTALGLDGAERWLLQTESRCKAGRNAARAS